MLELLKNQLSVAMPYAYRHLKAHRARGKAPSDPEGLLAWQIEVAGLATPVRGYRFVPGRRFSADFGWPRERLLIEVQGGIWSYGAHGRGWGIERDILKAQLAAELGYLLVPVTPADVRSGHALVLAETLLRRLGRGQHADT